VESRRVGLLLITVAVPGLVIGAWACGARTSIGLVEEYAEMSTAPEGGLDGHPSGSDAELPPGEGGRADRGQAGDGGHAGDDGGHIRDAPAPSDVALPIAVAFATGQAPQALALDGTYVYWENAGGTVVNCLLGGCPSDAPTVLATNALSPGSNLEELAVGGSRAYFVDVSGNTDSCAGSGCGGSPTVFWWGSENLFGAHSVLATDSINLYYTQVYAESLASTPLGFTGGGRDYFIAPDDGISAVTVNSGEVYFAEDATTRIRAHVACSLNACTLGDRTVCSGALISGVESIVASGGYVYFTVSGEPMSIYECPSQGGGSPAVYATDVAPYGLATDGTDLYWTNHAGSGTVARCALGATCSTPSTVASRQDKPLAIAVNATSVYWTTTTGVYEAPK